MDRDGIYGTLADTKLIKSRSVVQCIIEIPIEQWALLNATIGYPVPGEEPPVFIRPGNLS